VALSLVRIRACDPGGRALPPTPLTSSRVRRSVERILDETPLCSMATLSPRIRPHINVAYFAFSRSFELFFVSDPDSLHCRNLARHPWMSIAVYSTRQTWGRPDRGVQLAGTCRQARGEARQLGERCYSGRFPRYRTMLKVSDGIPFARYRLYRFVPSILKVLDERELGDGVLVTACVRIS
jgi:uncharacterized protein YhbP (UPF0306 family)